MREKNFPVEVIELKGRCQRLKIKIKITALLKKQPSRISLGNLEENDFAIISSNDPQPRQSGPWSQYQNRCQLFST